MYLLENEILNICYQFLQEKNSSLKKKDFNMYKATDNFSHPVESIIIEIEYIKIQVKICCFSLNATKEMMDSFKKVHDQYYIWLWFYSKDKKSSQMFVFEIEKISRILKEKLIEYLCKHEIFDYGVQDLLDLVYIPNHQNGLEELFS